MANLVLSGPDGRIEAHHRHGATDQSPVVLILHPDPRYGGTMNNKVVFSLYQAFHKEGFACMRFNFRGVGQSEGEYSGGEAELADSAVALDWLRTQHPNAESAWIAGFSFGAWAGIQLLMRRPDVFRFVAVSPPVNLFDFSFLAPCPKPGLIIQGKDDEIVEESSVRGLVSTIEKQGRVVIDYQSIEGADHFFEGKSDVIDSHVRAYVNKELGL